MLCGNASTPLNDTVRVMRPTTFVDAPTVVENCKLRAVGIEPILSIADNRPGIVIGRLGQRCPC